MSLEMKIALCWALLLAIYVVYSVMRNDRFDR